MNPQKMTACISPGTAFWKSLRWPSTCTSSRVARARVSPSRPVGRARRTSSARGRARRTKSQTAVTQTATSAAAATTRPVGGSPP